MTQSDTTCADHFSRKKSQLINKTHTATQTQRNQEEQEANREACKHRALNQLCKECPCHTYRAAYPMGCTQLC